MTAGKSLVVHLDESASELLARAAARAGVSVQVHAADVIRAAMQEDEAIILAVQALELYGQAFGLDQKGNVRKIAMLRTR
jgi:uncharacterized protein (DUF1778 family)